MKSALRWLAGVGAVLLIACIAVYGLARWYAARGREAAVAHLREVIANQGLDENQITASSNARGVTTSPAPTDTAGDCIAQFERIEELMSAFNKSGEGWCADFADVLGRDATEGPAASREDCLARAQGIIHEMNRFSMCAEAFLETDYARDMEAPRSRTGRPFRYGIILSADAEDSLRLQHIPQAIEDIKSVNRLSAAFAKQPKMICMIMFGSLSEKAFPTMQALVNSGGLTVESIRAISDTVPSRDTRRDFLRVLTNESSTVLGHFDGLRTGEYAREYRRQMARVWQMDPESSGFDRFLDSARDHFYTSRFANPLRDHEEQIYAESVIQAVEAAAIPEYEDVVNTEPPDSGTDRRRNPYMRRIRQMAVVGAELKLERLGLQLEGYRIANGHYPASLRDLSPPIGESEYIDPFSNKAFLYSATNGELLLYSVGPNHRDDSASAADPDDPSKDDIVWRVGK